MAVSLKHATQTVVADDGVSPVGSNEWNAEHTLTAAADIILGTTGAGAVVEIACTAAGRALIDDAAASNQRTTLGLVIGTDILAKNAPVVTGGMGVGGGLSVTSGGASITGGVVFAGATSGTTTLVAAPIAGATALELPAANDTLVGKATTDELTNKTLTTAVGKGTWTASGTWTLPAVTLGGAITYGGVALSNAVTGTGNMVLSASPTLSGTIAGASMTLSGTLVMNTTSARIMVNQSGATDLEMVGIKFAGNAARGITLNDSTSTAGAGQLYFKSGGTNVGAVTTTTTTTTYATSCDRDRKTDARPYERAGEVIDALKVYDFAWKLDGSRAVGVFAQEAHEVFPDAITPSDEAGGWQADYSKFVPVLIAEFQGLRKRVADLEEQVRNA